MHVLDKRVYAGSPGELAKVDTTEKNGGAVTLRLDGVIVSEDPSFNLRSTPGDERTLEILLTGATGASCVVVITTVEGGADGDLLMCQLSDPFPRHVYRFITTPAGAIAALGATRGAPRAAGPAPRAAAKKAAPRAKAKPRKKTATPRKGAAKRKARKGGRK